MNPLNLLPVGGILDKGLSIDDGVIVGRSLSSSGLEWTSGPSTISWEPVGYLTEGR